MNTNLMHNLLNIAIALISGASAFLLATGCTSMVNGQLDCSASWINPAWAAAIASGLAVMKLVINAARDGFPGMAKPQPPVADQVKTITVATTGPQTDVSVSTPGGGTVDLKPQPKGS